MNAEMIMDYLKQKNIGMSVVQESLMLHVGTSEIPPELMDIISDKTPDLMNLVKGQPTKEMKIEIILQGNNESLLKTIQSKLSDFWHDLKVIPDLQVKILRSVIAPAVRHD